MKVKELIAKLQEADENLDVVMSGYEGGKEDVEEIEVIKIKKDVNTEWWYGKHEEVTGKGEYDCKAINLC